MPAIVNTYGAPGSTLDGAGLQAYDLKDPSIITKLNKNRSQIYRKAIFFNQSNYQANEKPVIHYDNQVFKDPAHHDIEKTLHTDASADNVSQSAAWRHTSKHRLITSKVTAFGDGYGNQFFADPTPPYEMMLTTGCAINLMHEDSNDFKQFLANSNLRLVGRDKDNKNKYQLTPKGEQYFKEQMKLLYKRLLWAQNEAGVQVSIMPLWGGGVYLDLLEDSNKPKAKDLAHSALKEAIEELEQNRQLTSIQEIIYTLPDIEGRQTDLVAADNIFQTFNSTTNLRVTITNADMFDTARLAYKKGNVVGGVNAGSDRTVGGHYIRWKGHGKKDSPKLSPLEETIFNLTDAANRQAIDIYPSETGNLLDKYDFQTFDPSLSVTATEAATVHQQTTTHSTSLPPSANTATIETAENIDLLSKWSIQNMQHLNDGKDWKALHLRVDGNAIKGGTNHSEVLITKNNLHFNFHDVAKGKEDIRHALRLLLASQFGANYKNLRADALSRLQISFSGDEKIQEALKAVCKEVEFAKYFEIDGVAADFNPAANRPATPSATAPKPAPHKNVPAITEAAEPDPEMDELQARLNKLKS